VSGRSDEQLMEEALELYRSRYQHHFTYVHWWKIVRRSLKWNAHIAAECQDTKRSCDEFSDMLKVDTFKMEPWAKEAHVRAVTALGDELFGRDGSA